MNTTNSIRNIDEAIVSFGLDYDVTQSPLLGPNGQPIKSHGAVHRKDDVDMSDVFCCPAMDTTLNDHRDFFRLFSPYVQDGDLTINTGYTIGNGRRVYLEFDIPGCQGEVVVGDVVKSKLVIGKGYNGTLSNFTSFQNYRLVCLNGMTKIEATTRRAKSTKHCGFRLERIAESIDIERRSFNEQIEVYRQLAKKPMDDMGFTEFLRGYMPGQFSRGSTGGTANLLQEYFEAGIGQDIPGVRGTAYAAYNAVTQWITHDRGTNADSRRIALYHGDGAVDSMKALTTLLKV